MSSEVKANKLSPATGTALQISDSGDTTTIPSGATLDVSSATMTGFTIPSGQTLTVASGGTITNSGTATGFGSDNTPAFQAYLGTDQTISHDSVTKVTFDTESFDTDGAYDNSTNYRFTVPAGEGGKYFVYARGAMDANTQGNYESGELSLYKNGALVVWSPINNRNNPGETAHYVTQSIMTLAAADYVEVFAYLLTTNTLAGRFYQYKEAATFGAYKLIGL